MRAYLQQIVYQVRGSYWFIPSLMVISAMVLSQVTIAVDRQFGSDWLKGGWFVSLNQPDGARAILATVAGSMITVAGVTFSLTTLAVSHASTNFGPRLLSNFMHDRGNQVTLGTFTATFIYCLLVLRVVRGEDVVADDSLSVGVFVPQLSLLTALILTLGSVAELIFFIHHVPDSIHISTILKRLSSDIRHKLEELYPESIGDPVRPEDLQDDFVFSPTREVLSKHSGYFQGVDDVELMSLAKAQNYVIRLLKRPGDFLRLNEPIAEIGNCQGCRDDDLEHVRKAFTIGFTRTPTQDVFFIINELVEIAVRALSPGVNDPFTAMQCIDWLSVGMVQLAERKIPTRYRLDSNHAVRIITTEVTHRDFVNAAFRQLLPYAEKDTNVSGYLANALERTLEASKSAPLNNELQKVLHRLKSNYTEA